MELPQFTREYEGAAKKFWFRLDESTNFVEMRNEFQSPYWGHDCRFLCIDFYGDFYPGNALIYQQLLELLDLLLPRAEHIEEITLRGYPREQDARAEDRRLVGAEAIFKLVRTTIKSLKFVCIKDIQISFPNNFETMLKEQAGSGALLRLDIDYDGEDDELKLLRVFDPYLQDLISCVVRHPYTTPLRIAEPTMFAFQNLGVLVLKVLVAGIFDSLSQLLVLGESFRFRELTVVADSKRTEIKSLASFIQKLPEKGEKANLRLLDIEFVCGSRCDGLGSMNDDIQGYAATDITEALKRNKNIQKLHFKLRSDEKNPPRIGPDAMKVFAQALEANHTITSLVIEPRKDDCTDAHTNIQTLLKLNELGKGFLIEKNRHHKYWVKNLFFLRDDIDGIYYLLQSNPLLCVPESKTTNHCLIL